MKSQKMFWHWGLWPRNYIYATWVQKTYPAISPEPWIQFPQTGSHFFKNHEVNPINLWNFKKYFDLRATGLETIFGPFTVQKTYQAINPEHWLQLSQTVSYFLKSYEMNPIKFWNLEKYLDLGAWGLETTFRPLGSRRDIQS